MLLVCTERLELSPLSESDIPLFVGYRRHPDVARYQSWSTDFSVADAEALIAGLPRVGLPTAGEWVQLGARALVTGASARLLVGDVAIQRDVEQPHTFELGMTLAREHQRVGYALEALHGVIGWLMRDHDAHRIIMQGDASGLPANGTAPSTERGRLHKNGSALPTEARSRTTNRG